MEQLKTEFYKGYTIMFSKEITMIGYKVLAVAKRNPADFKYVTTARGNTKDEAFERIKKKLDDW